MAVLLVVAIEAPATTSVSVISSKRCSKCGTVKKSGKISCCARGGDWFKKCGVAGDANFNHTWGEGIKVCEGFAISLLEKARAEAYDAKFMTQPKSTSELRIVVPRDINTHSTDRVSYIDIVNGNDPAALAKMTLLPLFWSFIYSDRHRCWLRYLCR